MSFRISDNTVLSLEEYLELTQESSMESFTNSGYLNRLLVSFKDTFRNILNFSYTRPETLNVSNVERALKNKAVSYMELENKELYIPTGFKGNLGLYSELLKSGEGYLIALLIKLDEAIIRLGQVINQPSIAAAITKGEDRLSVDLNPEEFYSKVAQYFPVGNQEEKASVWSIYDSNNQIANTFGNSQYIQNLLQKKEYSISGINARIKMLSTYSELASKAVQEAGIDPSGVRTRELADLLQGVAKWIEWYSAFYTKTLELQATLKTQEKQILGWV